MAQAGPASQQTSSVPGASLLNRKPNELTVKELKRWLACRGAVTTGKKVDLVARVEHYIINGLDKNIHNPDTVTGKKLATPGGSWNTLRGSDDTAMLSFNHGHMIAYFVERQAGDKQPTRDLKSMSSQAYALSERGHVQNIQFASDNYFIHIRAECLPQMRKDRKYKLSMALERQSNYITEAECECPAGTAPTASCKHIAALCYTLDSFCKRRQLPHLETCTERLQTWNHPRPRRVKPIPVQQLKFQKLEFDRQSTTCVKPLSAAYDPRPPLYRHDDSKAVKTMYNKLEGLGKVCGFLHLLGPVVDQTEFIRHDHTYAHLGEPPNTAVTRHSLVLPEEGETLSSVPAWDDTVRHKQLLQLTPEEIQKVEKATRGQHGNPTWFDERRHRLTASVCGKVLQKPTKAMVREILYPKPFIYLPAPLAWGRKYEQVARTQYERTKSEELGTPVTTRNCGLFVHSHYGWLAGTPDATVYIDHTSEPVGILEIKCPYSFRFITVRDACMNKKFFCHLDGENVLLKKDHQYYDQIQVQLAVTSANWCDFCIFTTKGIVIDRIAPDMHWREVNIHKLEYFYDNFLLPEIMLSTMKPSYVL